MVIDDSPQTLSLPIDNSSVPAPDSNCHRRYSFISTKELACSPNCAVQPSRALGVAFLEGVSTQASTGGRTR